MRIFGFVMIFPRDFDRIQHWAHHQHTQDLDKRRRVGARNYTLRSYLLWFWGLTYWQTRAARIIRLCRGIVIEPHIRPGDEQALVIREDFIHGALYALIALA